MEVLPTEIRQENEVKDTQIGKEEVKLSLSADDMILSIKNPKNSTKKLLELMNELSKVAGYKNKYKLVLKLVPFLYTNNKLTEREIKKTIQFIIASKIPTNKFNQGC